MLLTDRPEKILLIIVYSLFKPAMWNIDRLLFWLPKKGATDCFNLTDNKSIYAYKSNSIACVRNRVTK